MSKRDVIESFDTITEQYQDELEENAVDVQNLHDDIMATRGTQNWLQLALSGHCGTLYSETSVDRKSIEGLKPIQNAWIRRYTRPGLTVNLPLWAKQQPDIFSLEYLLRHALENGWDLTEVGWDKAYELGVAQRFEEPQSNTPNEYDEWWTNIQAAEWLYDRLDYSRTLGYFKSLVHKKAKAGAIKSNGKTGRDRRFLPSDVKIIALDIINFDNKKYEEEQRRLGFNG
tara:strand:- start:951 stop:1634 length:684 start_codon:yes stop_codon:yes gene_type:complete